MRWILLALVTTTAMDAQNYAVHMSKPVHAGQSYTVTAAVTRLDKTLTGDRVLKAAEFQVNFQGRADVLEVDGKQQPFKIACMSQGKVSRSGWAVHFAVGWAVTPKWRILHRS